VSEHLGSADRHEAGIEIPDPARRLIPAANTDTPAAFGGVVTSPAVLLASCQVSTSGKL